MFCKSLTREKIVMPAKRPSWRNLAAVFAATAFLATLDSASAQPSPDAIVDAFEAVLGPVRTHRPSHPKGVCAAGHFVATAEGIAISLSRLHKRIK